MHDPLDIMWPAMLTAKTMLAHLKDGERVISQGVAFGDLHSDTELKADKHLGLYLQKYFHMFPQIGRITAEGLPDVLNIGPDWLCVDQLDGSLDFRTKGLGIGLPYTACFTYLDKKEDAKFIDIRAAGVIDLRSGDYWLAKRNKDSSYSTFFNHQPAKVAEHTTLDLGNMILFAEMYYPENRAKVTTAFEGIKGWLRNPGSAAYEMAMVASGSAVGFICDRQKQHELGAAYALVKGAGGVVLDHNELDIGDQPFLFNAQTYVVLACNMSIAKQIIDKLQFC